LILLDTSGVLAAVDPSQDDHEMAADALRAAGAPLILSPFVLAELDYLVVQLAGQTAGFDLLGEVGRGVYRIESFTGNDVAEARELAVRYADLGVGLADASIVVLARRYDVQDVLTLDERHFRVLQGPRGPFRLLPADA
jgi:predicted nucleic acid-binding protein